MGSGRVFTSSEASSLNCTYFAADETDTPRIDSLSGWQYPVANNLVGGAFSITATVVS